MDSVIRIGSSIVFPVCSSPKLISKNKMKVAAGFNGIGSITKILAITPNGCVSSSASHEAESCSPGDSHRRRSSLESLFCYDKPIPEEKIEKPVGISLDEKAIGNNPRCTGCEAKGAILCTTCTGSGLYVDSILESQGIIVKVRCLGNHVRHCLIVNKRQWLDPTLCDFVGCGGTGNIMCSNCGGRGHVGPK